LNPKSFGLGFFVFYIDVPCVLPAPTCSGICQVFSATFGEARLQEWHLSPD
jgi:hypothetical protein